MMTISGRNKNSPAVSPVLNRDGNAPPTGTNARPSYSSLSVPPASHLGTFPLSFSISAITLG